MAKGHLENVTGPLSLAQAATGLTSGVYTPFFGAWLAWRGLPAADIGLLISLGLFLRVPVAPFTGIIADARNDRRGMMLILIAIVLAGYVGAFFAHAPWLIFCLAIPAAIGTGAATPLLESVSVRLSERFGFDYGHVRRWASGLFIVGNIAGGLAVSQWSLAVVVPGIAAAALLNLIATYLLPVAVSPPPVGGLRVRLRTTLREAGELIRRPVFLIFLCATSLAQGSHAFYYAFGGLHWHSLGYSGTEIGTLWTLGVFVEIALMSISLKLFRGLGPTGLLLLGGLGCALRWTILAFDPSLPLVIIAQLLHGATFALPHLGAMYFILKAVPPRLAATAQSLYAVCALGLMQGLGTLASGPLYPIYGGHTYLLMSAMGLGAALFAVMLARRWRGGYITSIGEPMHDTI
jgi:PPP family 3-phenylpropionic acid transporter